MLRVIIILIGGLIGYSTIQAQPDIPGSAYGLVEQIRHHPHFVSVAEFVANWHFAIGLVAGLAAGEAFRVFWRYAKVATEFATVISGRVMQIAAAAAVVGIVIYFI